MLIGEGEKLPDGLGAHFSECFEQPFDNGAEHFFGLEIEGRVREARVASMEQGGAEEMKPSDGAGEEGSDDRLGRRVPLRPCQFHEVAVNRGRGAIFLHGWNRIERRSKRHWRVNSVA